MTGIRQFTTVVTWRRRQIEDDLVFNQFHDIEFFLRGKIILRIVFDFFLRQLFFVFDKLQQVANPDRIVNSFKATLAAKGQHPVKLQNKLRPVARSHPPLDTVTQISGRIGEGIEYTRKAGNWQLALKHSATPRKRQAVNYNPLRHKARMILFLPPEVKAIDATLWIASVLESRCESIAIFAYFSMTCRQLVLASTSPFRRQLLSRLGIPFETANPDADESALPGETPEDTALRLSEVKARAVAHQYPDALIIGSDQVACLDGQAFGKPGSHDNAVRQLQTMRGRTVNFFTGLCLLDARTGKAHLRSIPTLVTFRNLDDEEIENYLRKEQPYNCAGSAKSEGLGIAVIARMEGEDPNALIGLPLIALCDLLKEENVRVL